VAPWLDRLVLCYHGIHPEPRHGEVTPEALRNQLAFVARGGYRFTTFTDAMGGASGGRVAAVTFDDGIASALEYGLPVLDELSAPGTMFLTIDMLGVGGRLVPADAARLAGHGWEVGSHTVTHPTLTKVADDALRVELVSSRAEIERLTGVACTSVAYPKGYCDERVVAAAKAAGYAAGAALEGATNLGPIALAWPRVGVRGDDSLLVFRLKCSRPVRRLRSSRLQGSAGAAASYAGRLRRRI